MTLHTSTGLARPALPALADISRRRAELLRLQPGHQPEDRQHEELDHQPPDTQPTPAPHAANPVPNPAGPDIPGLPWDLPEAALHGVAGLAVGTIAPHTEAHPASILLQLLAAFGNLVGRGPHCMVNATRHALNLFLVLVGDSSKARKGTSWGQIARLFAEIDQPWLSTRVTTARLTASGLVYALRDQQPATDRRLLILSEEFASVLHTLKRTNGHLSPLLRCAWDSGHLPTLDMHQHLQATATHISLIAHITQSELTPNLPSAKAHNGFANRCLWAWVQRSNCLPDGGTLGAHELTPIARELRCALNWATSSSEIFFRRDSAAGELWQECYSALSHLRPGLRGAATSRAEAQVLRLSAIYAALDSSSTIGLPHLQAALAVWDYCYASASHLFGVSTGDPIADRIREAVEASNVGLSKYQIRRLFHGHVDGHRIDVALQKLVALGALSAHIEPTRGRPATHWLPVASDQYEENEEAVAQKEEPAEDSVTDF
jgi:hypothetical protein